MLAGLTGAVIVLPQCVAFATLAGMPVEYGLYCAMLPAIVAALYGSSWHLVSGPTNAISIVLFAALSPLAQPGSAPYVQLALTVTLLCGVMQLGMGIARLGALVNLISHTVIVGFMAAAAVVIANAQLRTFFGVDLPRGASLIQTWRAFLPTLDEINPYVTAVALVTLVTAIAIRRVRPRWPYMIFALIVGGFATWVFDLSSVRDTGISTVGGLPASLPPFSWPVVSIDALRETAVIAFAITILGLTEAVSIARSIALRSGQRIDSNQEFVGQGLSNIAGAFFSSYASSGSFNRSGVNYDAGARTPLAAAFSAGLLLLILFAVAPLAAYLPHAAMAAVLLIVAWGLIDLREIRKILRTSRSETAVLALTFFSGVLVSLEFCIVAGVMLSLLLYLNRTTHPVLTLLAPSDLGGNRRDARLQRRKDCPRLAIVRLNGSLFYGAVEHVRNGLHAITDEAHGRPKHLLLVGDAINFIDLAGTHLLQDEAARLARRGGALHLVRVKPSVHALLERTGALATIGAAQIHDTAKEALGAIYRTFESSECADCPLRAANALALTLPGQTGADGPRAGCPDDPL